MESTQTVTDQMKRTLQVPTLPKRIISLVPSQTELLYDLGLRDEVVGQTLFCIHPEQMHKTKTRVGGTKQLKHEVIASLNPDLIIGNKEENTRSDIEQLMETYPVWMSDIQHLEDALEMITLVGALVGKVQEASQIRTTIEQGFRALQTASIPKKVLYLIWRKPWMAAGHDTFINDMLVRLGLINVATNQTSRYPELTNEQLAAAQPEVILLSSEPYPFKEKHIAELQELCPNANILLVDGELFSWYGSRLQHSATYFNQLLTQL
jgi:ABC-type Fe3+-hydroxamate transport system substrate-binding protein